MTRIFLELYEALRSVGIPHAKAAEVARERPMRTPEEVRAVCDDIRAAGAFRQPPPDAPDGCETPA